MPLTGTVDLLHESSVATLGDWHGVSVPAAYAQLDFFDERHYTNAFKTYEGSKPVRIHWTGA